MRDAEHSFLALDNSDEGPMDQLRGHSITYRIAVGPQKSRKVFTLQTLPDQRDADDTPAFGNVAGFSLHAGVAAKADQRDKVRSRSDREGALGYKVRSRSDREGALGYRAVRRHLKKIPGCSG